MACENRPPEPEPPPKGELTSPLPVAKKPQKKNELAITWTDPLTWKRVKPKNTMRKASFEVPRADGDPEDAEMTVFYFGPDRGGSTEKNVARWIRQFPDVDEKDVKRSDREANGMKQHVVEIEKGTFQSGMPGGPKKPKKGFGMIAGIVDAPSGKYFFKLTGPSKTVAAERETLLKLLDSVEKKK